MGQSSYLLPLPRNLTVGRCQIGGRAQHLQCSSSRPSTCSAMPRLNRHTPHPRANRVHSEGRAEGCTLHFPRGQVRFAEGLQRTFLKHQLPRSDCYRRRHTGWCPRSGRSDLRREIARFAGRSSERGCSRDASRCRPVRLSINPIAIGRWLVSLFGRPVKKINLWNSQSADPMVRLPIFPGRDDHNLPTLAV